jgi:hypothetical protein
VAIIRPSRLMASLRSGSPDVPRARPDGRPTGTVLGIGSPVSKIAEASTSAARLRFQNGNRTEAARHRAVRVSSNLEAAPPVHR